MNSTRRGLGKRRARRGYAAIIAAVSAASAATVTIAVPTPAAAAPTSPDSVRAHRLPSWRAFPLPKTRSVPVYPVAAGPHAVRSSFPTDPDRAYRPASVAWPSATTTSTTATQVRRVVGSPLTLGPAGSLTDELLHGRAAGASSRLATNPAPRRVAVHVASRGIAQRAGVSGVIFSIAQAAGADRASTSVGLDYRDFAGAYGGGYGSRLHLVQLPACALTTPGRAACQTQSPIPTAVNDLAHHRLVADVRLPATTTASTSPTTPMVLAATSDPSGGGGGDYTATSLTAESSWTAGGSSGAFTYTVPIKVPQSLAGDGPSVALAYDSAAVDGLTSTTNTQPSWIGDGWSYSPGFVERSYKPCAKDGSSGSGDECWVKDNATVSVNGHSSRLVPTGTNDEWRMQSDDGSIIKEISIDSSSRYFNGMNAGTYWRMTTQDGTQYFFGADHLPASVGGDGNDASTNAAWGAPVFGNDAGEPCHDSGGDFNASSCTQGWRWNLDFVVDPHRNVTVYDYQRETNNYQSGDTYGSRTRRTYTRGGVLTSITYGQRVPDYVAGYNAAARILFDTTQRCDGAGGFDCDTNISDDNASHWPDVPWDQHCGDSGSCDTYSPTFWSTLALSKITTQVFDESLATPDWNTVDRYQLAKPDFPNPNGGTSCDAGVCALWLNGITHTGADTDGGGNAITRDPISFHGTMSLPNRVPGGQLNVPTINRFRLFDITTETAAEVNVSYDTSVGCTRADPPAEDNDTTKCFPVRWTPAGYSDPVLDWFTTYPVTKVTVDDNAAVWGNTDGSITHVTRYSYSDPAWHRDDSEFTPDKQRTWGDSRGYAHVTVTTGDAPDPVTKTVTDYLQGMEGDHDKDGNLRNIPAVHTDSGDTLTDSNQYSGFAYQTTTYSDAGGTPQTETVNHPWSSAATATQARAGTLPDLKSFLTNTDRVDKRQRLQDGSWRVARVASTFDANTGLATKVDDLGEINNAGDPVANTTTPRRCTQTDYAKDSSRNMLAYPAEVVVTAGPCTLDIGSATLSAVKTYYDNSATLRELAGPGDASSTVALKNYTTAGGATWLPGTDVDYDSYGRVTRTLDPMGRTTSTDYGTPGTSQQRHLPVKLTSTNAKGWDSTVTFDPARQLPITSSDVNGHVTSESYDGLGRLTAVWLPNHTQANYPSQPNYKYAYQANRSTYVTVTSSTLHDDGHYTQSISIYDAMLQLRETQATPANGNVGARVMTEARYDTHGWKVFSTDPFYNDAGDPSTSFYGPQDNQTPSETLTSYDGMGRAIGATRYSMAQPLWSASTTYRGADRVDTTPPDGGVPTRSLLDARGQQVELIRNPAGGSPAATFYSFDAAGRQTKIVGPIDPAADPSTAGDLTWTFDYNAIGKVIDATDPDAGETVSTYDDDGELIRTATTGPESGASTVTVTTDYDQLGRKIDIRKGGAAGPMISQWSYDPAGARGQLSEAVRYAANDGATVTYRDHVDGYNTAYQPLGETITIPKGTYANAGDLTYKTVNSYTPVSGLLYNQHITDSANSIMSAEDYSFIYGVTGLPVASGGFDYYESNTNYDPYGRVLRAVSGVMPKQAVITNSWDEPTGRLLDTTVSAQGGNTAVDDIHYSYDQAGNIASALDARDGGTTAADKDRQCYQYDQLGRLSYVWTDSKGIDWGTDSAGNPRTEAGPGGLGQCKTTDPGGATLTGPAPYRQHFFYDLTGNRTKVSTATAAVSGGSTTTTSTTETYTASATHAVKTATTGSAVTTYTYDGGRPDSTKTSVSGSNDPTQAQTYAWTPDARLDQVTTGPTSGNHTTTSYGYDPDGNQIARQVANTKNGTTTVATLITIGLDQVFYDTTGTGTGTGKANQINREYPFPGGATAVRVSKKASDGTVTTSLHWHALDSQGSPDVDITATDNYVTRHPRTPFGEERTAGRSGSHWSGQGQFLNDLTDDTTGLITVGARQYDPALGRFITVDPVLDPTDPESMNGYAYADNDPVNGSDPSGLCVLADGMCMPGAEADTGYTNTGGTPCDEACGAANEVAQVIDNLFSGDGDNGGSSFFGSVIGGVSDFTAGAVHGITGAIPSKISLPNPLANIPCGSSACHIGPQSVDIPTGVGTVTDKVNAAVDNTLHPNKNSGWYKGGYGASIAATIVVPAAAAARGELEAAAIIRAAERKAAKDAAEAGAASLPADVARTFTGGAYSKVTTAKPTTLYRVYGGTAKQLGAYWTRTLPQSSAAAVKNLALDPAWGNTAEQWVSVRVPAGTTFYEGTAAAQSGLPGGGSQVFFASRVDSDWITGGGALP